MKNRFILSYFANPTTWICEENFKSKDQTVILNLDYVVSITELETFILAFFGKHGDKYSVVTMRNDDKYFIREKEYNRFIEFLKTY